MLPVLIQLLTFLNHLISSFIHVGMAKGTRAFKISRRVPLFLSVVMNSLELLWYEMILKVA